MPSTPNNPTFKYIFNNRFENLHNKKPLPSPLYIGINKFLGSFPPIIGHKQEKIIPWALKTPEINLDLAYITKLSY